jgi:SAM-dependent methyltransferase
MESIKNQKKYISKQSWYQQIELSNGLITKGTVSVSKRMERIGEINFTNKSVLDIGCNSGGNCLWAKKFGAKKVVGIDLDRKRISQAQKLANFEKLKIDFNQVDLFEYNPKFKFDIIMCFAVITEIQDLIGALDKIKSLMKDRAYIELNLAKPKFYLSTSRIWLRGFSGISRKQALLEIYQHKIGLTFSPSIEVVSIIFGSDFKVERLGRGERYDLIQVVKKI